MHILEEMVADLQENHPPDKNDGYDNLIQNLIELLEEEINFKFDDFRNEKHAILKIALLNELS